MENLRSKWDGETCYRSCKHCEVFEGWKGNKCQYDPRSVSVEGVFESCKTCPHWQFDEVFEATIDLLEQAGINADEFEINQSDTFVALTSEHPYLSDTAREEVCKKKHSSGRVCERLAEACLAWEYFKHREPEILVDGKLVPVEGFPNRLVCSECPFLLEHKIF